MIVRVCPNCKAENDAGLLNCTQCGASLAGEKMIYKAEPGGQAQVEQVPESQDQVTPQYPPLAQLPASQPPAVLAMAALERRMKSGASWFYWIAAMTVINSVLIRTSMNRTFIIGLGATIIVDVFSLNFAVERPELATIFLIVGIFLDLIAVSLFILFGYQSGKGRIWSFITGMVVYLLDSLILLVLGDFFALIFHGLALFYIFAGFRAARELGKLKSTATIP